MNHVVFFDYVKPQMKVIAPVPRAGTGQ